MAGDRNGASAEQRQPLLDTPEAPPKRRSTLLTVCPFILGAPAGSCRPTGQKCCLDRLAVVRMASGPSKLGLPNGLNTKGACHVAVLCSFEV